MFALDLSTTFDYKRIMARDDEPEIMHPCSVRMPAELRAVVEERAKAANRSFSREVVFALRQYYAGEAPLNAVKSSKPRKA